MPGKNASLPRMPLRGGGSISSSAGVPVGIRRTRTNLLAQIHRGTRTIVGGRVHHAPGLAVGFDLPSPRASMKGEEKSNRYTKRLEIAVTVTK